MGRVRTDDARIDRLSELLLSTAIPPEQESISHSFAWPYGLDDLANCYLAIVAICHQTSPIGERRLEGYVEGTRKSGWDYLKERFLLRAIGDGKWISPSFWKTLRPDDLSALYADETLGLTLGRVAERSFLINDLGRQLQDCGVDYVEEVFEIAGQVIAGDRGFLRFLERFEAYRDPLHKKGHFFLSLAIRECQWSPRDPECLLSPIDYHELRGHLRIGTIAVVDPQLLEKVRLGLPLSLDEDYDLRAAAQEVNNRISKKTHLTASVIHYLFWNVFRNCCPRESDRTHCVRCSLTCSLPAQYTGVSIYEGHCLFSSVCRSVTEAVKIIDPPHIGHYY